MERVCWMLPCSSGKTCRIMWMAANLGSRAAFEHTKINSGIVILLSRIEGLGMLSAQHTSPIQLQWCREDCCCCQIHRTAIQKPKPGQAKIMIMDKQLTTLMMTSVPLVQWMVSQMCCCVCMSQTASGPMHHHELVILYLSFLLQLSAFGFWD